MRQLHVAAFVSLDGVMQGPGGPDEDRSGGFDFGGWVAPLWDDAAGDAVDAAFAGPPALLLGRKTYDIFAGYWPHHEEQEIGRTLNAMPKYVATRSPRPLDWNNSIAIGPDAVAAVRTLKAEAGPDLLTQGSSDLIQSLMAAGLVDRLTVMTFPVLLGQGKRLFDGRSHSGAFKLASSTATPGGVVVSTYERTGEVPTGDFSLDQPTEPQPGRDKVLG